jgi:hypothetical protein
VIVAGTVIVGCLNPSAGVRPPQSERHDNEATRMTAQRRAPMQPMSNDPRLSATRRLRMTGSTDPGKQKRRVDFVVVAKSHSQEELAAALRCAIAEVESDSTRSRAASVWRVFREEDGNVDLSVLIDDVMRSVELRRRELGDCRRMTPYRCY